MENGQNTVADDLNAFQRYATYIQPDIMNEGPEDERILYYIVSRLSEDEQRELFAYAALGDCRSAGRALGISHMTVSRHLNAIRAKAAKMLQGVDVGDI